MRKELEYPFDSQYLLRKKKSLRRELLEQNNLLEKHVAILGGSTTSDIKDMLGQFLLNYGIRPVFYESEYGQYWQDAMFPNSELEALAPDVIYIHTTNRSITAWPESGNTPEQVDALLEQGYGRLPLCGVSCVRPISAPSSRITPSIPSSGSWATRMSATSSAG